MKYKQDKNKWEHFLMRKAFVTCNKHVKKKVMDIKRHLISVFKLTAL